MSAAGCPVMAGSPALAVLRHVPRTMSEKPGQTGRVERRIGTARDNLPGERNDLPEDARGTTYRPHGNDHFSRRRARRSFSLYATARGFTVARAGERRRGRLR